METWELTEYEQERKPQEISIDSEMAISPRSLYREIVCPICLDILSQTRAAPDCLHRFCLKCIDKAVKKECPVCRKKLPSQLKGFRADPKFDQLIAKIYNGYRSKPIEANNNNNNSNNTATSLTAPEFEIILRSLNGPQQTRYIKCPKNTTVDHLSRYLAIRPESSKMPDFDNNQVYKVCIPANRTEGHYEMLAGTAKLDEIMNSYRFNSDKPMELYFVNPSDG